MYKPAGESLAITMAFNTWLEKEHPAHSEWDFDTKGAYQTWLHNLFVAYKAGMKFERDAFLAGM